jgi:hypothetical protein
LVDAWPNPVVCGDAGFDESSDWTASSANDAAPRAGSMAELRRMPHGAAFQFNNLKVSKRRAIAKNPMKCGISCAANGPAAPAIDAATAEISVPMRRFTRIAPRLYACYPKNQFYGFETGFREKRPCLPNLRHAPS